MLFTIDGLIPSKYPELKIDWKLRITIFSSIFYLDKKQNVNFNYQFSTHRKNNKKTAVNSVT